MHYIRFLKPPRVTKDSPRRITTKITITTDLGESFLCSDCTILADVQDQTGTSIIDPESRRSGAFQWQGCNGMRALEIVLPLPKQVRRDQILKMVLQVIKEEYLVDNFEVILEDAKCEVEDDGERGRVVAVRSMPIDWTGKNPSPMDMVERVFKSRSSNGKVVDVHIWEETGESIARHIWDAGLVLSSYLASILASNSVNSSVNPHVLRLPQLETLLKRQHLNILELGAGCGIVGLTLASHHKSIAKLLLTDLSEASSILEQNITHFTAHAETSNADFNPAGLSHQVLDWSDSQLSSNVRLTTWDLILVADCTYNPDVVPDLVKTLNRVTTGQSADALVCLAMKVRHDSEMVFFDLMKQSGFVVSEQGKIRLPVLGDEGQEIEIFIFRQVRGA